MRFTFLILTLSLIIPFANAQLSSEVTQHMIEANITKSQEVSSDRQAELFVLKCAGCHTVGKGKLSGPDLINAASFPLEDLISAIKRMQEQVGPMEEDEVKGHVSFIKSINVQGRITKEFERISKIAEAKLEPPDVKKGLELFIGKKPFTNSGVSCISCHSTREAKGWGGGKLGPPLTDVFKDFSKANLISSIVNSQWKVMKDIYKDHPITKQEAVHIVAYLESIKDLKIKKIGPVFHVVGLGGFLILLGGTAFFYRKRLRSVRNKLRRR
jgi:cytochrome c2